MTKAVHNKGQGHNIFHWFYDSFHQSTGEQNETYAEIQLTFIQTLLAILDIHSMLTNLWPLVVVFSELQSKILKK